MNRAVTLALLIGCVGGLRPAARAASGTRAAPAARLTSVLEGVKELEKPVTYAETKIPLGELVQKVAQDTGVDLTAAKDVADEPVAVVVKEMPARELLEQLADLLDYRWARHLPHPTPDTRHPTPFFEIYQDLAGKQREAALRNARFEAIERRFQEEVRRCVDVAALPPAQIQAIVDAEEQRSRELAKMTPEERGALLRSPGERERQARAAVARELSVPIPRALAQLLGRLSPQQWATLHAESRLVFATQPGPGELPLRDDTAQALRASRPTLFQPGVQIRFPDPAAEERARRHDQEVQQQWAGADGYQVEFRLEAERLQSAGMVSLWVNAAAARSGDPQPIFAGGTASLRVAIGPAPPLQRAGERTPEQEAALEKDPVVGVKMRLQSKAKPRSVDRLTPGGVDLPPRLPFWQFRDLLPDLARTYDVSIISDAYSNASPGFLAIESLPAMPIALFA